ncbi:MAG: LruC domain-containing protein [Bacteroidales bacterium]
MKTSKYILKIAIYAVMLVSFAFIYSCKNDLTDNASVKVVPGTVVGFNYENKSDMQLNLTFRDSYGKPNPGVFVKIYAQDPCSANHLHINKDLQPNIKGTTDANGVFSMPVPIAGHLDRFYVVVDNLLYNRCLTINKSANYTTNIYPAGYGVGVLKSSATLRGAVSAPIAYTHSSSAMPISSKNFVLSSFDPLGLPSELEANDPASGALVTRITNALPEGFDTYAQAATNHYFDNVQQANIEVIDNANVWVTFISEGAGINSTVGYFYYPTATPPSDVASISKRIIMFANASTPNDGSGQWDGNGSLSNGKKVKLKYQNPTTGEWSDVFPSGTTISWFLTTSGWGGAYLDSYFTGRQKFQYSIPSFNAGGKPQTLLLYDASTKKIVLGFEDVSTGEFPTGNSGAGTEPSDRDYNDVVFAISANPITAINTNPLKRIYDPGDTDGDGVPDVIDDYPSDSTRAYNNYYPGASQFGTLAFEDNWPSKGDYDMNDLVVDYRVMYVTNGAHKVKDVELQSRVEAIGATYRNGFAWELNADQSNISSITTTYSGPGTLLPGTVFPLNANATKQYESGITPSSKVVIPFFDNAFTLFGAPFISGFVNTVKGATSYAPVSVIKKVTFTNSVSLSSLGSLPYNPFIVVDGIRAREVHKTGNTPTSKAAGYFDTQDDRSSTNGYYTGNLNYPWVLDTPILFSFPTEDTSNNTDAANYHISKGFTDFNTWVLTNGASFSGWYTTQGVGAGSRNVNYLYNPR